MSYGISSIIRRFIYRPERWNGMAVDVDGVHFAPFRLSRTGGGGLTGLITTPVLSDRATILFLHGNGGNAATNAPNLARVARSYNVVLADYTGYGANPGSPTQESWLADAQDFWTHTRPIAPDRPLLLVGHSLGGALAVLLAAKYPVSALLTINAVARIEPFVPWYAKPFLLDPFDAVGAAQSIAVPWLIAHAPDDTLVPFVHAQELDTAAGPQKASRRLEELPGRDHQLDAALIADLVQQLSALAGLSGQPDHR